MSYYTFFYPKDYNPNGLTDKDIADKLKKNTKYIKDAKRNIKLYMIKAYGDDNPNKYTCTIEMFLNVLISTLKDSEALNTITWIDNELKEYKSVAINHAACDSEYILEEQITYAEERLEKALDDLLILACIKTTKEDVMEYLKSEYIEDIEEIFGNIEEDICELSRNQFMLKYFDTKKAEDELHDEKEDMTEETQEE